MQRHGLKYYTKLVEDTVNTLSSDEAYDLRFNKNPPPPKDTTSTYGAIYHALGFDNQKNNPADKQNPDVRLINNALVKRIAQDKELITVVEKPLTPNSNKNTKKYFIPPAIDANIPGRPTTVEMLKTAPENAKIFELLLLIRHYNAVGNLFPRTDIDFTYDEMLSEFQEVLYKQLYILTERHVAEANNHYRYIGSDQKMDAHDIDKYVYFLLESKIASDKIEQLLIKSIVRIKDLVSYEADNEYVRHLAMIAVSFLTQCKKIKTETLEALLKNSIDIAKQIEVNGKITLSLSHALNIITKLIETGKISLQFAKEQADKIGCSEVTELLSHFHEDENHNLRRSKRR